MQYLNQIYDKSKIKKTTTKIKITELKELQTDKNRKHQNTKSDQQTMLKSQNIISQSVFLVNWPESNDMLQLGCYVLYNEKYTPHKKSAT